MLLMLLLLLWMLLLLNSYWLLNYTVVAHATDAPASEPVLAWTVEMLHHISIAHYPC